MGPAPVLQLLLFLTSAFSGVAAAGETCLSQPQLFGVIFGSVAAAFFISAAFAVLLYVCFRGKEKQTDEKSAYANDACDVEDKGVDAQKIPNKDKMTMIDSFKLKRKVEDVGTQKAYSMEFLNEVDGKIGVQLSGQDIGGLGFNIQGNMNEGIFIKEVISKGIAEQCGNILVGDKIKSLTINFESIVYEDAVTILSYASPYKVKLELERKLADSTAAVDSDDEKEMRYHPLFRSNTMTHVHFNPLGSSTPSPQPQRCASANSTQKHALPKKEDSSKMVAEPDSTIAESSDYGSDGISECRESTASSDGTQKTLSDRIEITDIIFDKIHSPTPPAPKKLEHCVELPPKPRKIVSRSPSPHHKPPPSPKVQHRASSPIKQQKVIDDSTQTARQSVISQPTQTPIPPPISSIPNRSPTPPPPAKELEVKEEPKIVEYVEPPAAAAAPVEQTEQPPQITEARISRIPKRAESIKTPIIERKLPALPKSVTQRSHSADKNDNVWSRLYQEKRGQLRKTRDLSSPPTAAAAAGQSGIPAPKIIAKPTEDKYGTLTREKRDRLMANDAELERQKEELKKLGIL